MRYLTLAEVLHIHEGVLAQTGGLLGIRDLAALEPALLQPKASAGGADVHPSLVEKAAALCYSLCSNHPVERHSGAPQVRHFIVHMRRAGERCAQPPNCTLSGRVERCALVAKRPRSS
jgi:hypothetical protein